MYRQLKLVHVKVKCVVTLYKQTKNQNFQFILSGSLFELQTHCLFDCLAYEDILVLKHKCIKALTGTFVVIFILTSLLYRQR